MMKFIKLVVFGFVGLTLLVIVIGISSSRPARNPSTTSAPPISSDPLAQLANSTGKDGNGISYKATPVEEYVRAQHPEYNDIPKEKMLTTGVMGDLTLCVVLDYPADRLTASSKALELCKQCAAEFERQYPNQNKFVMVELKIDQHEGDGNGVAVVFGKPAFSEPEFHWADGKDDPYEIPSHLTSGRDENGIQFYTKNPNQRLIHAVRTRDKVSIGLCLVYPSPDKTQVLAKMRAIYDECMRHLGEQYPNSKREVSVSCNTCTDDYDPKIPLGNLRTDDNGNPKMDWFGN